MGFLNPHLQEGEEATPESEIKKEVLKLGIRKENGFIYFNELLYRCMRRVYGNFKLNKKMQIIELKTQFKLFRLTIKARTE